MCDSLIIIILAVAIVDSNVHPQYRHRCACVCIGRLMPHARFGRLVPAGHRHCTSNELMPLRMCSSIHLLDSLLARLLVCLWAVCKDNHTRSHETPSLPTPPPGSSKRATNSLAQPRISLKYMLQRTLSKQKHHKTHPWRHVTPPGHLLHPSCIITKIARHRRTPPPSPPNSSM